MQFIRKQALYPFSLPCWSQAGTCTWRPGALSNKASIAAVFESGCMSFQGDLWGITCGTELSVYYLCWTRGFMCFHERCGVKFPPLFYLFFYSLLLMFPCLSLFIIFSLSSCQHGLIENILSLILQFSLHSTENGFNCAEVDHPSGHRSSWAPQE